MAALKMCTNISNSQPVARTGTHLEKIKDLDLRVDRLKIKCEILMLKAFQNVCKNLEEEKNLSN